MTKPTLLPSLDLGQALRSRRRPLRRSSNLLSLEQRFMFDGAALADAAHAADATAMAAPAVPPAVEVRAADPARDNGKKEYVIVDTSLADYKALEAGVRAGVGIVEFDGSKDGLAQIAAWAGTQSGIDAIHILSHGDEGLVKLGSTRLIAATLSDAAIQSGLAQLGSAMTADGDLMLYGCDAGAGAGASALLDGIAAATGADVAASADATGAAALSGDWNLEVRSGAIDADELSIDHYGHLLSTVSFSAADFPEEQYASLDKDVSTNLTLRFTGPDVVRYEPDVVAVFGMGTSSIALTITALEGKTFTLNGVSIWSLGDNSIHITWTNADGSNGNRTQTGVSTSSLVGVTSFTAITNVKQITFTSSPGDRYAFFQDFIVEEIGGNAVPANSVAPAITGTAKVGNALSATTGAWSDDDGDSLSYSYKWYRADAASGTNTTLIAGATASSYVLTANDAHKYVRVEVTASDGNGANPTADSAWTAVSNAAPVNTAPPSMTGTAQVGNALSATTGAWSDADGDSLTYTYEWHRASDSAGTGETVIAGATNSNYSLTTADAHKYVRVVVTASDALNATATANASWTVVANSPPNNSAMPSVSGTATVGNALSATTGTWSDADADTLTYSYQWYRANDALGTGLVVITGATASTYTLGTADAHKYVRVGVTANDGSGTRTANSSFTAVTDTAPTNITPPAITGTASVGSTVTASSGTWSDADGDTLSYTYQWYRASDASGTGQAAISGANAASYTLTGSDGNKFVRVVVTANDGHGSTTQTAQSSWTNVLVPPSVSSIVRIGASNVPASATSAQFTVTFNEAVTGVDAGDFALALGGTASGTIAGVTGSGATYTVTVNGLSGDGNLGLDLKNSGTGIQNGSNVAILGGYTGGQVYLLDHTAPAAPSTPDMTAGTDIGSSNTDNITSSNTPTFTGTAESGTLVKLYDGNGTELGSGTATGGTWTITSAALAQGSHTITAKATDAAGNVSAASGGLAVTIDTTAPAAPSVPDMTGATDSGDSNTDNLTNTTTPTFSGTAEAGSVVKLYDGATEVGSATATGGNWTITTSALAAGSHTITARATDTAGNVSPASAGLAVTIDTTAPAAPSAPDMTGASDSGSSNTDNVTSNTTPTFSGTAEAGSVVKLYDGIGTELGSTTATDGNWTITTSALAAGSHTITAKSVDAAGNVSSASGPLAVTIDTSAPAAPSTPDLTPGSDSGGSVSDNITNYTTPTFGGTAQAGSVVRLYDGDGTELGSATATGGNWTITSSALAAGSHTITAKATDLAGNVSAASGPLSVTIDTSAPSALALASTTFASINTGAGASLANLSATDALALTYALANGDGTNNANNGSFAITGNTLKVGGANLAAGTYKLYLSATDGAGNVAYQAFTVTVVDAPTVSSIGRTSAQAVPASTSSIGYTVTFSQPVTGVDASDFALTTTGTATGAITSVTGSGTTWTVMVGTLGGDGTLRLDLNGSGTGIANGGTAIAGGYTSGPTYVIDRVAPAAPAAPDMLTLSDTGSLGNDNITNATTPTFSGTAEAGSFVRLYDGNGNELGSATATGGAWSITSSALAAGSHVVKATATDAAGNVSTLSAGLGITVDTSAPASLALDNTTVPTASAAPGATVGNLSATDGLAITYSLAVVNGIDDADNARFAIAGNALKVGGTALTAGTYRVYAVATDAAGNASYQALTITVVDAPAVASIVRSGGAAATVPGAASTVSYTVTFSQSVTGVDAGDFVLTSTGSAAGSIASVSGSGSTYTVTVGGLSGDGTLRLDLKGSGTGIQNGSSIAIASGYAMGDTYGFDRVAPSAPSAPDLSAASDTGNSNTDNLTAVRTPTLSGTAEAGSTVTLYDGATVLGTTTATGGYWSFVPGSLADGTHTITAKATDAAGNVSAASAALTVNIDGTAPTVASVAVPANGTYTAGQVLTFTVNTSEAVAVDTAGGTPALGLTIGGTARSATYVSGSGTSALQFSYTVQPGDLDADGIAVGALSGNGGTLKDNAGNVLTATLNAVGATAGVLVDAVAPAVTSVSVPANGTYTLGQNMDFTVHLSEAVTVDTGGGTPRIALTLDTGGTVYADYVSGSGSTALVFRHVVATGELDATGVTVGALSANGGTLRDAAGNNAGVTLNAVGSTALVNVDGSVASVAGVTSSTADGAYKAGATVTIAVNMTRPVVVDTAGGTPTLALNSGGTATYTGSTGSTLNFTYVVGAGQNAADLDFASVGAVSLNGATIKDASGTRPDARLVLPAPGAAGSLGSANNIVIDTVAPATTGASAAFSSDTGGSATDLVTRTTAQTVSGTLSANLAAGETVWVSLDNGATWRNASAAAGQNTWSLAGVTLAGSDTLQVRVRDAAGNDGAAYSRAYVLDTVAPAHGFSGVALSADTGATASDFITRSAIQAISATLSAPLAAGERLLGSTDGGATWTDITAKASGTSLAWDDVTFTGSGTLALRVIDLAGNTGATWSQAYVLDTLAPATGVASAAFSNDSGASATDLVTNAASQTVSGTLSANLAAGETVHVSLDNGATWSTATAAAGQNTWSVAGKTLTGSGTLLVKVTDVAGNDGAAFARAYTLDTTAPATTVGALALSADSGASATDFITNSAAQTVSATLAAPLAAGERMYGSLDGSATWTDVTAGVSGTALSWSGVTLPASGTIKLKVVDLAGNDGAAAERAYVVDTVAPATTGTGAAFSADTGRSATDLVTSTAAQAISGKLSANLAAGETVWVSLDNGATWAQATAAVGQDSWALPGQVLAGSGTLQVSVRDAAGNAGPALSAAYVLDTTAPAATITSAAFSADSGRSTTDLVTNVAAQTISGKLAGALGAGETLMVSLDDGATWTGAAVAGDSWTLAGQVLSGAGTLKARVVDAAGNAGAVFSQAYVFDATAPGITFGGLALSADTGVSATDFITNVAAQTVRATLSAPLAAGELLYGSTDGGLTWTDITARVAGTTLAWNGVTLDGRNTLALKVVDAAGNEGAAKRQDYALDVVVPDAPTVDKTASASLAPVLTGTAKLAAGEVLTVSVGGATYEVSPSGTSWSLDLATAVPVSGALKLAPRTTYDVVATVTDLAGNTNSDTGGGELVTGAAPAIAVTGASLSADSGASATDFVTNVAGQTIRGTLSAPLAQGDVVQVSFDGGATWRSADVFAAGSVEWSASATLAGSGVFAARVSNAAGQGQVYSQPYVLDTLAPSVPTVTSQVATGSAPVLGGSASVQAGEVLTVSVGGATYRVTPSGGSWSLDLATAVPASGKLTLTGGTHEVSATVTDLAGNASGDTSKGELVVVTAPAARVTGASLSADTGASATDFVTRVAAQTVSGTLSAKLAAGDTVEVSVDGGASWSRASAAAGADTWTASVTLNGSNTLMARVVNANGASASYAHAYVLDTSAPALSVVAASVTGGTVSGTLSGPLQAGESVEVSLDAGRSWQSAGSVGSSSWTVSGTVTGVVKVRLVDAAGNETGTQEVTAPTPPVVQPPRPAQPPVVVTPQPPVAQSPSPPAAPPIQFLPPTSQLANPLPVPDPVAQFTPAAPAAPQAPAPSAPAPAPAPAPEPAPVRQSIVTLTQPSAAGGFQALVMPASTGSRDALVVNAPITDMAVVSGSRISLQLTPDTFAHTNANAIVVLSAQRSDGTPLPSWLAFNAQTGQFKGTPPAGFNGVVEVRVVARDSQGNEAAQVFKIVVGKDAARDKGQPLSQRLPASERGAADGRAGLSQQLRGARAANAERLAALSHSAKVAARRA